MIKGYEVLDSLRVVENYIEFLQALKNDVHDEDVVEAIKQNIAFSTDLKDMLVTLFPTIPLKEWKSNQSSSVVIETIDQSPSDH